nr:hypothetical protein CFP56_15212 [Quercus suber]
MAKKSLLKEVSPDCPASSNKGRTVEEGLQYGAWLHGNPHERFQKEPGKHGGGENQGSRGGVAGVRLEQTLDQFNVAREKTLEGGNHVTESFHLGCSSSTWEEANLEVPKKLTMTLHGNGKGNGAGVKAKRYEEDIPLGFKGQHQMEVVVTKDINKIEGYKGNCKHMDQKNLEKFSSPSKKSNGPSLGAIRANPSVGSFELG